MTKRMGWAIALTIAAMGSGCVAEMGSPHDELEDGPPYDDDLEVGLAVEALTSDIEFTWSQGQPEQWLMPEADGICMLTGVGGKFRGGGERVQVEVDPIHRWWRLTGTSSQTGVSARARCLRWSEFSGLGAGRRVLGRFGYTDHGYGGDGYPFWEYRTCDFVGSNVAVSDQHSTFCWLSSMSGLFEGGAENVHVRVHDDRNWRVGAQNCTEEPFVDAGAMCADFGLGLRSAWYTPERTWRQGEAPVDLGSVTGSVCGLTHVGGRFSGAGESVWITQRDGRWWLEGHSLSAGVEARARCVWRTQSLTTPIIITPL